MRNWDCDGTIQEHHRRIGLGKAFIIAILDRLFDMLVRFLGRDVPGKCLGDLSRNSLTEVVESEDKLNWMEE